MTARFSIPQALAAQTLGAPAAADAGSSGSAALTARFLTLAADPGLAAERVFTAGAGLGFVDAGPGLAYTLSVDATVARSTWAVTAGAGLSGGGVLSAGGITLSLATPGTLTVASANAAAAPHTHAITSSANPGAAAALLATTGAGALTLTGLLTLAGGASISGANFLTLGGDVTLNRTAASVLTLGTGDSFRSFTYTSGLAGWTVDAAGTAEFSNVRVRGEFSASVFKVGEITATAGTFGVFKSAAVLAADYVAPGALGSGSIMVAKNSSVGGSLLAAGDIIRIKSFDGTAVRDLWLTVTAVGVNSGPSTSYTVRLEAGAVSVTLTAGTAISDYGPAGSGHIMLSADDTMGPNANMSIADHAGSPWATENLRARLGNLNGSYGVATDVYGLGVGDYAGGNYLRYAPDASGFVMKAGGGNLQLDANGVSLTTGSTQPNALNWMATIGGAPVHQMYGAVTAGIATLSLVSNSDLSHTEAQLYLNAETISDQTAFVISAGTGGPYAALTSTGTLLGLNIGAGGAPSAMLHVHGSAIVTGGLNIGTATGAATNQLRIGVTSALDGTVIEGGGAGYQAIAVRSTDASGVRVVLAANAATNARINVVSNHPLSLYTNGTLAATLAVGGHLTVVGGLGANGKSAQTAFASGGAVVPGAGAFGASSAANFAALVTLVSNIRTCLVNNGLMS